MLRVGVVMYQTSLSKGQELVAQRMVREFRAQNHDAFLITSPYHDGEPVVTEEEIAKHGGHLYLFDERLGIPVIRVASVNTSWPPRRITLADFVGTLSQIVDEQKLNVLIVHSTLWNGPEDVLKFVEWKRRLARDGFPDLTPLFCHMSHFQDASPERYEMVERSYRDAWNSTSLSQIVRAADLLLVVSPFEKQVMKELGADESKCFLFPGGVEELTGESGDPARFRKEHGIPPDAKVVTSLGTIEERKNTMAVISVAKRLADRPDIRFVIAGLEPGEYAQGVRAEATSLPNVSILGAVSDEEKSSLIKTTTVNIIMSRSEALGIAQLEFMANGVPVVTSGTGGQQWVVKDGEDGMVVDGPEDIAGAARAVAKIAESSSLRRKLSANARRKAASYSMSRLIHELAKRLENMRLERSDEERLRRGLSEQEEVLEAMVSGRTRVIVTNRRILVRHDRSDRMGSSIELKEIRAMTRATRYPWEILAGGALCSAALALSGLLTPFGPAVEFVLRSTALSAVGTAIPAVAVGVASVAVFLVRREKGYVLRGGGRRVFVPSAFLRLLRMADTLSPVELFATLD